MALTSELNFTISPGELKRLRRVSLQEYLVACSGSYVSGASMPGLTQEHTVSYKYISGDKGIASFVPPLQPAEVKPMQGYIDNYWT